MRQWMFGLAAAAAVLAPAAARADDKPAPDAKAVEVVKKSIEAHGGADLLDKHPAASAKIKGSISVMGLDIEFTGEMMHVLPDKMKSTMNLDVMGQKITVVQVVNGKDTKVTANGMAAPLPDGVKEEMVAGAVAVEAMQLTPLLDPAKFTIKSAGEGEAGGEKADVVVVTSKRLGDKEWKLFFDRKTGLLAKIQRKGIAPDGAGVKEVDAETVLEDYKKVDGMMTPHKMTTKHDGQPYVTITVTEAKNLEKIDAKEFATDD